MRCERAHVQHDSLPDAIVHLGRRRLSQKGLKQRHKHRDHRLSVGLTLDDVAPRRHHLLRDHLVLIPERALEEGKDKWELLPRAKPWREGRERERHALPRAPVIRIVHWLEGEHSSTCVARLLRGEALVIQREELGQLGTGGSERKRDLLPNAQLFAGEQRQQLRIEAQRRLVAAIRTLHPRRLAHGGALRVRVEAQQPPERCKVDGLRTLASLSRLITSHRHTAEGLDGGGAHLDRLGKESAVEQLLERVGP